MKRIYFSIASLCLGFMLSGCAFSLENLPDNTTESQKTESSSPAQTDTTPTPHTHKFSSWITVLDAGCDQNGVSRRACSCGESEEKTIEAKGHSWGTADCGKAPVCKKCQAISSDVVEHVIENGVCTKCAESFRTEQEVEGIIKLINTSIYKIDSAGGVSIDIGWENTSDKTVKYITFTTGIYNAVGDPLSCEIRDYYETNLKGTGPYAPGDKNYTVNSNGSYKQSKYVFGEVWYADTAKSVKVSKIKIEYTDGSVVTLNEKDVQLAYAEMSLSENVEKVDYKFTNTYTVYGVDGELTLKLGLLSDEGYYIRKPGSVKIKLTNIKTGNGPLDWIYLDVICEKTLPLTNEVYPNESNNEMQLVIVPEFSKTGQNIFEIEFTFTFDDGTELTHSAKVIARVI